MLCLSLVHVSSCSYSSSSSRMYHSSMLHTLAHLHAPRVRMSRGEAWEKWNEDMLTTHLHLVQWIRMKGAYLHSPICLYDVNRDNSAFTFRKLEAFEGSPCTCYQACENWTVAFFGTMFIMNFVKFGMWIKVIMKCKQQSEADPGFFWSLKHIQLLGPF